MFESRLQQLASGASINVAELDSRHALIKFTMQSGVVQPVFVIPFDEVWEFSVPSIIKVPNIADFPQALLAALLTANSKNKRSFWCVEQLNGSFLLSAMLNFPDDNLTPAEFLRICNALVLEVEKLEANFRK